MVAYEMRKVRLINPFETFEMNNVLVDEKIKLLGFFSSGGFVLKIF